MTDRDLDLFTTLLLDPCLTTGEAAHEVAALSGLGVVEWVGSSGAAAPSHPIAPRELR